MRQERRPSFVSDEPASTPIMSTLVGAVVFVFGLVMTALFALRQTTSRWR